MSHRKFTDKFLNVEKMSAIALVTLVACLCFPAQVVSLHQSIKTNALRRILTDNSQIHLMPCCYDGLTARIIEKSNFNVTFMSGFGVSAAFGYPDVGLMTQTEMTQQGRIICNALQRIPCIGDGDTGYGNEVNLKRTVELYAQAGLSGIMIEDQVSPKRCGHLNGKMVVSRNEAYNRIKAAVDQRDKMGTDIVILARTDANIINIDEAIERCKMFRSLGADITFVEGPKSKEEMLKYCSMVDGPKMANMLEGGLTPILPPHELREIGYHIAAYPITLLSSSIYHMNNALNNIKNGKDNSDEISPFKQTLALLGLEDYNNELLKYKV